MRKTLIAAELLKIDVELIAFEAGSPPQEFVVGSPLGKMPLLVSGDFVLPDSSAIVAYLDTLRCGPASIFPEEADQRGLALWYEEYADTAMQDVVSTVFFNRVVKGVLRGLPPDTDAIVFGEQVLLPPVLAYLEKVVPPAGAWLTGIALSIADISIGSALVNFDHAGLMPSKDSHRRLRAWADWIFSQSLFARTISEERAILASRRTQQGE